MKEEPGKFRNLSDGTSRETRIRRILDPAGIKLDESGPEQLTAFVVDFARHINYYRSNSVEPDGTWEDLFMRDELVVMSCALVYDLRSFSNRFFEKYNKVRVIFPQRKKTEELRDVCRLLIEESRILNNWYGQLESAANHTRFYPELHNYIENKLRAHWQYLVHLDKRTEKFLSRERDSESAADVTDYHFHPIWKVDVSAAVSEEEQFSYEEINVQLGRVRNAYYDMSDAFYHLRKLSKELIPVSLEQHDHLPHIALLHTFVRLFEHNRAELNMLPGRHLEHYYFDVLKIKPRSVIPDKTIVVFQLAEHVDQFLLPAATPLLAEKNEDGSFGQFLTDEDIVVNKIRVAAVKTLFTGRSRDIYTATETAVINKVETLDVYSEGKPWADGLSWSTFGYSNSNTDSGKSRKSDAETGFAVSSFLLQMQQGEREIKFDLECDKVSCKGMRTLLQEVADHTHMLPEFTDQELDKQARVLARINDRDVEHEDKINAKKIVTDILNKIAAQSVRKESGGRVKVSARLTDEEVENQARVLRQSGTEPGDQSIMLAKRLVKSLKEHLIEKAFYKVFTNAFNIEVTTPEGWSEIPDYMVTPPVNGNSTISFHFNVPASFPAIVNYNPEVHATNAQRKFNTSWPVIRITINPQTSIYPYSFMSKLEIIRINVMVHVNGLRNLDLANQNGPLSGAQPFTPFGSVPVLGSYLLVGNNEVFSKSLSRLELNMEWQGLPTQPYGFTEHYMGYPNKVVNESFRCRVSVLNNYEWVPKLKTDQQEIILFRSRDPFAILPDYAVEPVTFIDYIDAGKIQLPASYQDMSGSAVFNNDVRRGFIKLELCNPPMAFGHDPYPMLLSDSIIKKSKKIKHIEPNKPYTPVISTITLNYSSSHDLNFKTLSKEDQQQGSFFHINPFGTSEINPATTSQSIFMVPQMDNEGGLYIGLAGVNAPESISLFFHLHEKPSSDTAHEGVQVKWSYLSNNEWRPFHDSRILKDDTGHFIKSGIVMLELPDGIDEMNTTMPAGLFWIRAEVPEGSGAAADTVCIYTQAVGVSRKLDTPSAPTVLAENTIQTLSVKLPEIAMVSQPLKSTNGLPAEQANALYTRISERLRHKQRACTPKDYELMVLEKFPSIYKAKCVITRAHVARGGIVRVMVLPDVYSSNNASLFEPKADAWELEQIRQYLLQFASPFTHIQVMNAEFERLKVMSRIHFKKGFNNGLFIQKLEREIQEYLTPWMRTGNSSVKRVPAFGEPVNRQNLLSFVESLPYVDYVPEFGVSLVSRLKKDHYNLRTFTNNDFLDTRNMGMIYPGNRWSMIISADQHYLVIDDETNPGKVAESGINHLAIGTDFIISSTT